MPITSAEGASVSGVPQLHIVCTPFNESNLTLAEQLSCDGIVYYNMNAIPDEKSLLDIKAKIERHNMKFTVLEGGPRIDKVIDGTDDGTQVTEFCEHIRMMGRVGIPVLCWNFMHWGCRVARTSFCIPIRGGAIASGFDVADWDDSSKPGDPKVTAEELWPRLEAFLKTVVPVAEESNVVLAMHPDDPPRHRVRGIERIMTSVESFDRMLAIVPSKHNAITFDVSLFGLMLLRDTGVCSTPELIYRWASQERIGFVHFRDVSGTIDKHVEEVHDVGNSDHPAIMKALVAAGFSGPMRPDHVPLMEGEPPAPTGLDGYIDNHAGGYTMLGRHFACGYLRGLIQSAVAAARSA